MLGGNSILLLRGGGEMDTHTRFGTPSTGFALLLDFSYLRKANLR